MLESRAGEMVNIVVVVDKDILPSDFSTVMWKVFNNADPRRDIVRRGRAVTVDATKKIPGEGHEREWPDDIEMSGEIKARIDGLWPRLGIK